MTRLRIPTSWRQTSWLFTSVAKKLNSGLTEQNPLVVRTGFEPVTYGFQIRCFNHSAKLPSYIILRLLYTEQAV